jgi:hypothetical protein
MQKVQKIPEIFGRCSYGNGGKWQGRSSDGKWLSERRIARKCKLKVVVK